MGDGAVAEEADDVGLAEGDEVADRHRQGGQDPDGRAPDVAQLGERQEAHRQQPHEPRRLGAHRQVGGHRGGRPLVGVGGPEVEGHGRHLEGEAPQHQQDAHDHQRLLGEVETGGGGGDGREAHLAGDAVDQRHAEQQDGGRQHPDDEELEGRLVGAGVALAPARQQEAGGRHQLEADEDGDQVAGRRHHHRPQHRAQQQEVELALVVAVGLDVGHRQQQRDEAGEDEETLEHQREVVHDVGVVEQEAVVSGQHRQAQEGEAGRHQAGEAGDGREPLGHGHHIQDEDDGDRPSQDELGRQCVVVDHPPNVTRISASTEPSVAPNTTLGKMPMMRMPTSSGAHAVHS